MISVEHQKRHWYSYLLAAYLLVMPVNTGFTGIVGDVSISNYIAIIFIALGLINLLQSKIITVSKLAMPIYIYFIFTLISIIWSNGSSGTWYIATYIMNAGVVLIGGLLTYNQAEIRLIESATLLGVFFALYAAYLSLGSLSIYGRLMITFGRSIDPNQFACDLFPIIALSFCKFYQGNKRKWVYILIFSSTVIITLMTGSRGAILGIIGMGIAFLLLNRENIGKRVFYTLLLLLVMLFVLYTAADALPRDLMQRFAISNVLNSTGSGRYRIWINAISTFKSSNIIRMLIGYGYGSFSEATKILNAYGSYYYAHNMFVQTLIEGGIVGIILLINMLKKLFKMANLSKNLFPVILLVGVIIASLDLDIQASRLFSVAIIFPFIYKDAYYDSDPSVNM